MPFEKRNFQSPKKGHVQWEPGAGCGDNHHLWWRSSLDQNWTWLYPFDLLTLWLVNCQYFCMVLKNLKLDNEAHKNQFIWRRISHPNNHFLLGYLDSRLNCAVLSFSIVKCLNNLEIHKFKILVKVDILMVFSILREQLGTHTSGRAE